MGSAAAEKGRDNERRPSRSWVSKRGLCWPCKRIDWSSRERSMTLRMCLAKVEGFALCSVMSNIFAWPPSWLRRLLERLDPEVLYSKKYYAISALGPRWCIEIRVCIPMRVCTWFWTKRWRSVWSSDARNDCFI